MKCGAQTALAIGVGYILGRRHKMRLATMVALGAATGGAAKLGPAALRQGTKYLGKTDIAGALGPQVTEIVDTVRGELLDATKSAAAAAVTSRIDSLSDNLHDRAETLRNPEAAVGKASETAGETVGRAGETVGRAGRKVGGQRRQLAVGAGRVRPAHPVVVFLLGEAALGLQLEDRRGDERLREAADPVLEPRPHWCAGDHIGDSRRGVPRRADAQTRPWLDRYDLKAVKRIPAGRILVKKASHRSGECHSRPYRAHGATPDHSHTHLRF